MKKKIYFCCWAYYFPLILDKIGLLLVFILFYFILCLKKTKILLRKLYLSLFQVGLKKFRIKVFKILF